MAKCSFFKFLNKVTRASISCELFDPVIPGNSSNIFEEKFLPECVLLSMVLSPNTSLFSFLFNELCSSSLPHVENCRLLLPLGALIAFTIDFSWTQTNHSQFLFFYATHSATHSWTFNIFPILEKFNCTGRFYPTIDQNWLTGSRRVSNKGPKHWARVVGNQAHSLHGL